LDINSYHSLPSANMQDFDITRRYWLGEIKRSKTIVIICH